MDSSISRAEYLEGLLWDVPITMTIAAPLHLFSRTRLCLYPIVSSASHSEREALYTLQLQSISDHIFIAEMLLEPTQTLLQYKICIMQWKIGNNFANGLLQGSMEHLLLLRACSTERILYFFGESCWTVYGYQSSTTEITMRRCTLVAGRVICALSGLKPLYFTSQSHSLNSNCHQWNTTFIQVTVPWQYIHIYISLKWWLINNELVGGSEQYSPHFYIYFIFH